MVTIRMATKEDAAAILALQKLAYRSEARLYNDWAISPLVQTIESLLEEFAGSVVLKAMLDDRLVGSVRARLNGDTCEIARLAVHPDLQGRGIGSELLRRIEGRFDSIARYELFTGSKSEANIRLYERHGYKITHTKPMSEKVSFTFMEKRVRNGGI